MDTTIKINLVNPGHRLAMRALLTALDAEQEKAEKPQGRAPDAPAAAGGQTPQATPAKPAPAAPPPAAAEPATPPAEGDGEAVLTAAQRDEVIRLQTERVQDVDTARANLKETLQACFKVNSLSALRQKWLPDVLEYVKTGVAPDTVPF